MLPYAKGREQLSALARGPRLGPNNTVHYIMNHVIEPTPESAGLSADTKPWFGRTRAN
jgi:hypothetical protein